MDARFVWCDLSTFDLNRACDFYGRVLGWSASRTGLMGVGNDYTLCHAGGAAAAAIYTMPPFFRSIGMPSFWMSYVRVASLDASYDRAAELGAKCEIEPTPFDENSRFALVRDPSGAGFTLYEGPDPWGRDDDARSGSMAWNELHVTSPEAAAEFYGKLFGWRATPDPSFGGRHNLLLPTGEVVGSILQIDDTVKGPKNYWAVVFATGDLNAALHAVTSYGGTLVASTDDRLDYTLASDDQGAVFCLTPASG
ncbi:MAG: VOC family protein [Planctomycetota bacterium]